VIPQFEILILNCAVTTQPQPTEWSRLGVFAPRQGFADPLRQLMQVIPEGTGCSMERLSSENHFHSDHLPYFFNLFSYFFVSFSLFICLRFFFGFQTFVGKGGWAPGPACLHH